MSWWEQYLLARDAFAEGIDTRFFTIEYLDWLLQSGRAAIWFSDNAAIVCEIKAYPTGVSAVCGVVAAGDPDEIAMELIPKAEQWGREHGCSYGQIESRPAWQKKMKPYGYEPFQLSLVKEL